MADLAIALPPVAAEDASPGDDILRVEAVDKRFTVNGGEIEALRAVDLTIGRGEFICLIGPSGCGKSTLLRMIGGFETPSTGRVLMNDAPVTRPGPDRGMVFQDYGLFPWLSVRGNIAFGPAARGLKSAALKAIVDRFIAMIENAREVSRTDVVIAGMIVIGLAGFLSDQAIRAVSRRLLRWNPQHG